MSRLPGFLMAGRRTRRSSTGFTLAEAILVIVIGVVLLASGTLMYANAKNSTGMTRARDKVLALQQLVEQMSAEAGGGYPEIGQVAQAWTDKRKGDVAASPFGGRITHGFDPVAAYMTPVGTTSLLPGIDGSGIATASARDASYHDLYPQAYASPAPLWAVPLGGVSGGLLEYRRIGTARLGTSPTLIATASFVDDSINKPVEVRASGYVIFVRNTQANGLLFVAGAAPAR